MDNDAKPGGALGDARGSSPPVIILVEPQLGENIGTAARAMSNFGLSALRIVNPRDGWPNGKAVSSAANAHHIVDAAVIYDNTEAAVADINMLYATTARPRDLAKPVLTPETWAREVVAQASAVENSGKSGILFGRERAGLNNDDIALADGIIMAPVNPAHASLNLAQAVLLIGYEWLKASGAATLGRETEFDGPAREGLSQRSSRPATKDELIGFFEHLEAELDASGFLRPPEKRPIMVRNIRSMFSRIGATEQEVRTLRGIVASLTRAHRKGGAG